MGVDSKDARRRSQVKIPTRRQAEKIVRDYIQSGKLRATWFLDWEVKFPLDHPENETLVKEFVDTLVKMGLARDPK